MVVDIPDRRVRSVLSRIIRAAIAAADPARAISELVSVRGRTLRAGTARYVLRESGRLIVVGAGKASARMAAAFEQAAAPLRPTGLVTVKHGHAEPTRHIEIVEAAHPAPDRAGQRAAERTLRLVESLTGDDVLVVLLSGGASSLWPLPAEGLTLADKRRTTDLLLRSGATINEMNAVRKHLSRIKGGRLAAATRARVLTLILSDVIGDDLGTIGSGPTAPDPTTYRDAIAVLQRYQIWQAVPPAVRRLLLEGRGRRRAESPKPGAPAFRRVRHVLLGNIRSAVEAAAKEARRSRWRPWIVTTSLGGEARAAAQAFVRTARGIRATGRPVRPPACVIAGGETTVTLNGHGRGGRAQEFALAAAVAGADLPDIWFAAVGTDGTDGPTDAAGAIVGPATMRRAKERGVDAHAALAAHDAYRFFRKAGGHIVTGPTGTNVNDLYLALIR